MHIYIHICIRACIVTLENVSVSVYIYPANPDHTPQLSKPGHVEESSPSEKPDEKAEAGDSEPGRQTKTLFSLTREKSCRVSINVGTRGYLRGVP